MARVQRLGRMEFGRKPDAASTSRLPTRLLPQVEFGHKPAAASTEPHQPMWVKAADCCANLACKACALRAFLLPLRAKKKDVPHARLT